MYTHMHACMYVCMYSFIKRFAILEWDVKKKDSGYSHCASKKFFSLQFGGPDPHQLLLIGGKVFAMASDANQTFQF